MLPNNAISFQLYSSRNFPPLSEQLKTLKSLGFTDVQPYFNHGSTDPDWADPAAVRAVLDETGLTSRTGHYDLPLIEADFATTVATSRILGNELVIAPWLPPADRPVDRAGWEALAARLDLLRRRFADEGIRFGWHTHDFEFRPLPDGTRPVEIVLGEDLLWEPDVAWMTRAWVDPRHWLRHYAGRVTAVHVKDTAPAGEKADESGWADLGTGVVDWASILPVAIGAGAELLVLEHDNPKDYLRFARHSIARLKELAA